MQNPLVSKISQTAINEGEAVKGSEIRQRIFDLIVTQYPDFKEVDYISIYELNTFRRLYLTQLIEQERGELAQIDRDVMMAIQDNAILSENIQDEIENQLTLGQRLADKIASFGGSWGFIASFFTFIILWMMVNTLMLGSGAFDRYPFILLNLILSCIAAIQAPIIMMSQNRQEQKDRLRAEHDYKINLKAELEIKLLSEKMDHLLIHQNKKLLEIQEVQIDYLEDLLKQSRQPK
jgi:uncharacterized membrane protein